MKILNLLSIFFNAVYHFISYCYKSGLLDPIFMFLICLPFMIVVTYRTLKEEERERQKMEHEIRMKKLKKQISKIADTFE